MTIDEKLGQIFVVEAPVFEPGFNGKQILASVSVARFAND